LCHAGRQKRDSGETTALNGSLAVKKERARTRNCAVRHFVPFRAGKLLQIPAALRRSRDRCGTQQDPACSAEKLDRKDEPPHVHSGLLQVIYMGCKRKRLEPGQQQGGGYRKAAGNAANHDRPFHLLYGRFFLWTGFAVVLSSRPILTFILALQDLGVLDS
jgi:hypothetical protein